MYLLIFDIQYCTYTCNVILILSLTCIQRNIKGHTLKGTVKERELQHTFMNKKALNKVKTTMAMMPIP